MKINPNQPLTGCRSVDRSPFASLAGRSRRSSLILAFFVGVVPMLHATLPSGLSSNDLYKKGYLDVTLYAGVAPSAPEDLTTRTNRTLKINEAIVDARENKLALYFPSGVYQINGILKAYTEFSSTAPDWASPAKHIVIVGSTKGSRPVIKIAGAASVFDNANDPQAVFDFKNFDTFTPDPNAPDERDRVLQEHPSNGYHQMLRGIDIDCNGRVGAIGVYFNQAQDSSVENVKVTATGSYAGFRGLPARGWGAVNIQVEGGKYGLDLTTAPTVGGKYGSQNAGTVVVGAVLRNQTENAVAFTGFSPLTLVGFEIEAPAGASTAAITVMDGARPHECIMNLIDGKITVADSGDTAIDDQVGRTFYARNVYVYGTTRMVRTGSTQYATQGTTAAAWKRIAEYCLTDPVTGSITAGGSTVPQSTYLSNNAAGFAPTPIETKSFSNTNPPIDISTKHTWGTLPSVDDTDAWDPVEQGQITLNASGVANIPTKTLNDILLAHPKVFLPKGIYRLNGTGTLNGPVKLPVDAVLFGAARCLTRLEVQHGVWTPTQETAIVTTEDSTSSTAYLGDLSIAVDTYDDQNTATTAATNDWFTAVWWRAGRNSMVHMGQPYRAPATDNDAPTNGHSLVKVTDSGGGRWYFLGSRKTGASDHADFRVLKVEGAGNNNRRTEPLWFYGLNLEHPRGPVFYANFKWTNNVRIYCGKTEYPTAAAYMSKSVVIRFDNCDNVALYGLGAIRNGVISSHGNVELYNATNSVVTTIAPQRDDLGLSNDFTFRSVSSNDANNLAYPHIMSLFRTSGDLDEASMAHADIDY